jgi:hypothetical protein
MINTEGVRRSIGNRENLSPKRGQRRFHITEQVVKFDHDSVITSILCPVGDEGENTFRISANLVSTRY